MNAPRLGENLARLGALTALSRMLRGEVLDEPKPRAECIARVTFLMPGLTDHGLAALLMVAEHLAVAHARDLTSGTLAAEQAAREAASDEKDPCAADWLCGKKGPGDAWCDRPADHEPLLHRSLHAGTPITWEAGAFGCQHAPPCEATCPVRSFPAVEEAQEGEREALITLLDLHDASGDRLRVQHDGDHARSFVVLGEPEAETVFELGPDAGTRIVGALSDLPAPRRPKAKQAAVKP